MLYSDHLEEVRVLREALREALEGWDQYPMSLADCRRIKELKKVHLALTS
jgi:hypothetical protein